MRKYNLDEGAFHMLIVESSSLRLRVHRLGRGNITATNNRMKVSKLTVLEFLDDHASAQL